MYNKLQDLIRRRTAASVEVVAPDAWTHIKGFAMEDGMEDIMNGVLARVMANHGAGVIGYGGMKFSVGFLAGIAYARAYGIPDWIDHLYSRQLTIEEMMGD